MQRSSVAGRGRGRQGAGRVLVLNGRRFGLACTCAGQPRARARRAGGPHQDHHAALGHVAGELHRPPRHLPAAHADLDAGRAARQRAHRLHHRPARPGRGCGRGRPRRRKHGLARRRTRPGTLDPERQLVSCASLQRLCSLRGLFAGRGGCPGGPAAARPKQSQHDVAQPWHAGHVSASSGGAGVCLPALGLKDGAGMMQTLCRRAEPRMRRRRRVPARDGGAGRAAVCGGGGV